MSSNNNQISKKESIKQNYLRLNNKYNNNYHYLIYKCLLLIK